MPWTGRRVLPVVLAVAAFALAGASPGAAEGARPPCSHRTYEKAVTLEDADSGKTVCVRRGAVITVSLHAPPDEARWSPILPSSDRVLVAEPSGRLALPIGVTGAVYQASHRGHASLTSSRPPCSPPARAGCDPAHTWLARVVAR